MNKSDISRNLFMLKGPLAKQGYDWWWHSFTGYNEKTNEERAFFIEYFVVNPKLGSDKPILGQLPANKASGAKPSYVMIKVGCWGEGAKQIHNFYPISEFNCNDNLLDIKVADCTLTESHIKGEAAVTDKQKKEHPEYMSDAGTMTWDLAVSKQIAFHVGYGASKFLRWLNAFEMFWHAEGIKTQYSGTLTLDGEIYKVNPETSYGYADKNWGKDFTSPWVWLASSNIKSNITNRQLQNTAFDIGGGRPKIFKIPLDRKLLSQITYEGEDFEFNFSKFWTLCKTEFKSIETDDQIVWTIKTKTRKALLEAEIRCYKKDMLLINYEAPNGKKLHNRLWNGGNGFGQMKLYRKSQGKFVLIDDMSFENTGCEYGEYDE